MATANPIPDVTPTPVQAGTCLLVLLTAMPQEQLESVLANLTASFAAESLLIAAPEALPKDSYANLRFVAAPATNPSWTLTAADFVNAFQLAQKNDAGAILMLGPGADSLGLPALRDLANAVQANGADLAIPCYDLPPHAGLLNSAILYPLSRALFASRARFPLAIDLGLSMRMAERLHGIGQRLIALNQIDTPLWPINEAVAAGYAIREVDVGARVMPQPGAPDLNTILPLVTASLFSDIEAKAAFWQRARQLPAARNALPTAPVSLTDASPEIAPMLQAFRLAYTNLQGIWSLVLPPNALLGLKRLYVTDAEAFRMPESLWARIVFDFVLAYRLRTINRGHLLGALIPLYRAWTAGHINTIASGMNPEHHVEAVAAAFETEKPYIVSRWRWPDRFNP